MTHTLLTITHHIKGRGEYIPNLHSGNILVSDMQSGLYVLEIE